MADTGTADHAVTWAVVLNWNRADDTLRAVASLLQSRPRCPRVIVVDNGSRMRCVEKLREAASRDGFALAELRENRGFAGGMNAGIERALTAGAARVLVVNNDVEVHPDCVARLEEALARDARLGAVGPLLLEPGRDGRERVWAAGGAIALRENVSRLLHHGDERTAVDATPRDVDFLPGCVLLLRREALEEVGFFDETYFCYMEDLDLGLRLRAAGWRSRLCPAAEARHVPGSSTGGGFSAARKYMMAVNAVRFLRRHGDARTWAAFLLFDVIGLPVAFLRALLRGRPRAGLAKARGVVDGLRGLRVTPARLERYLPRRP